MRRRDFIMAATAVAVTRAAGAADAAGRPVVLELFTSEACSSCPPAEALLGELIHRPGVVALACHVDYWNNAAWRDPYASRFATDRQRAYAARLHADIYTPALVINGTAMVVGSDRQAVAAAMTDAAPATFPVTLQRRASGLRAVVGETARPLTGLFVAYDRQRVRAIGGGENDGRRLTEYHIVRQAMPFGIPPGVSRPFPLPPVTPGRGVVLLVQSEDLRIQGAAHLLPSATASDMLL